MVLLTIMNDANSLFISASPTKHHTQVQGDFPIYPIIYRNTRFIFASEHPLFLILVLLGLLDVLVADIFPLALEKVQVSSVI